MTLLTLASKQIWPQVLALAHLTPKPERVYLLHSGDMAESKRPAQRLKRFLDTSSLVPKGGTRLEPISDVDFGAIETRLDELQVREHLPLSECILNFTGGNKLMATAAFRWAARRGVRAFYLERRNQITWFDSRDGDMRTRLEEVDGHSTDHLDPVALLRCQLDSSEVERPGQRLQLNGLGRDIAKQERLNEFVSGSNPRAWLELSGEVDREFKEGDRLEFVTAAVLLGLGVHRVQRSLRLKAAPAAGVGTRHPHAEIDLLFVWGGRLWLVDCKDRIPAENLATALRRSIGRGLTPDTEKLLERIQTELIIGQTKAMKEDLLAVREMGGLLGNVVCIRASELNEEVAQFARQNYIALVHKHELIDGLRNLLFPERSATNAELAELRAQFSKSPSHLKR